MPLKIIRESDPVVVSQLIFCFYGEPGVGKTSLGFTAADVMLLDFDHRVHASKNRKDSSRMEDWDDAAGIVAGDLAGRKTVAVDTAGRALDKLSLDIIKRNPKNGKGGSLSLPGFGILKNEFIGWKNMIQSFGLDLILLCHSDEKQKGEETIVRLDVQGGSKNEIYKCADVMGRLYMADGKRYLNFNPTEHSFGKNPSGLGIIEVPDFEEEPLFLAKLIQGVKDNINSQTEGQRKAAAYLEMWKLRITEAITAADFDGLLATLQAEECSEPTRRTLKCVLRDHGISQGVEFDKASGVFVKKAA